MIFKLNHRKSEIIKPFVAGICLTAATCLTTNNADNEHSNKPNQSLVHKIPEGLKYLFGAAALSSFALSGIKLAEAKKEIKENKPKYEELKKIILSDKENTKTLEDKTINQYTSYSKLCNPQQARFLDGNTDAQCCDDVTENELQEQFLLRQLLPDGRIIEHLEPCIKDGVFSQNAFTVKGTIEYTPNGQKIVRKTYSTKYGTKLEFRDNIIIHAEFPKCDKKISYYYDSDTIRKALNRNNETSYYMGIFQGTGIVCKNEQLELLAGMYIGEEGADSIDEIFVVADTDYNKLWLNDHRIIDAKNNLADNIRNFDAKKFYYGKLTHNV